MRTSTPASIFSHTRGTPRKTVGCTSRRSCWNVSRTLAEVHRVAGVRRRRSPSEPLGDVAERQVAEARRPGSSSNAAPEASAGEDEVGVGEHRALRRAGGARTCRRGSRWPAGRARRPPARRSSGSVASSSLHAARCPRARTPARVDHDEVLSAGSSSRTASALSSCSSSSAMSTYGAAVAEQVRDLGRGAGRVDPDADRAERLDREVGDHPLGPVLGVDGDPVARADAERAQPAATRATRSA